MSFRLRYPSSYSGDGAFTPGAGASSATSNQGTGGFNPMSGTNMGGSSYTGHARLPFNGGVAGETPSGGYSTRGNFSSGVSASGTSYQGAASFNPFTGASTTGNFNGGGITPFVRGNNNGFGGDTGSSYSGPTGQTLLTYTYAETGNAGPHAVTSLSDGSTFTYDANGNMTTRYDAETDTSWTYTFDAENRLVSVSDGSTSTTYVYDGNGSRIKRLVDNGTTETTTLYVAGMEITLVDDIEESRTIYYSKGGAFRVIGGDNEGLYFRHNDHLGSTSVLTDSAGLKVEGSGVLYAPFGEIRQGEQSALTDFGYTGQRLDSSTGGLMYYGARYYLPGLRRFISADNLVPNLTSQGLNRYSYVFNNPIKYIDPSGHYPLTGGGWMEESNWNGGSAWRPAAAQQPQQRLYTPPTPIQILNKELDGFGTNVNFDPGISSSRQEDALEIILEDTTQMGTTAANTYNRYQDRLAQVSDGMITAQHVTAQEAFITIYQRQNITIRNGYYVNTVNNWSGQHNGCEKSVCSFEIGLNALLGSGDDEGSNLFIHEVSHSVTIQRPEPQWYPSHLSVEVSDASGNSSPVNVRDIMAPDAGNHPPSNDCPARCETSVDIATFWILGNYDVGSTVGQRDAMTRATNLWMNPWIIQQLSVSH